MYMVIHMYRKIIFPIHVVHIKILFIFALRNIKSPQIEVYFFKKGLG